MNPLTLKIAPLFFLLFFYMTLQLMMMHWHHTKFGYKRFSSSEDITQRNNNWNFEPWTLQRNHSIGHFGLLFIMVYHQTKFGFQRIISSEDIAETVISWLYKPSFWSWRWRPNHLLRQWQWCQKTRLLSQCQKSLSSLFSLIPSALLPEHTTRNSPFSPKTILDWNELTEDVAVAPTMESFWSSLPESLPSE